jgi:hypothetical protein
MVAHLLIVVTLPGLSQPTSRALLQPCDAGQALSRRALIRGAAAGAAASALPAFGKEPEFKDKRATDAAQLVGSGGLSSYNSLKLTNALKELSDAPRTADIKPSVDAISTALPLIQEKRVPDQALVSQAIDALAQLVLTAELQAQVASLGKQSASLRAGIGKGDANAAAVAATALVDELTDFCYSYEGAQKPLAELRKGAPAVFDKTRTKIELPVSGKSL